ncbi:hypothetical protein [Rickettsia endosymbiont of Polydrusus tereticollis]|uniref:actin-based motility regulator RoaM n=1 Tax=Rickettsia endosymbiont of Polydrusus tereticollis TaxID=3066251 RepID=UPI0031330962
MPKVADNDPGNAIKEKWADLKSLMSNVSTRTQADTFLAIAGGLVLEAEALGIKLDISGMQETLNAKVKSHEVDQATNQDKNFKENELLQKELLEELEKYKEETQKKKEHINLVQNRFEENSSKSIKEIDEDIKKLEKINKAIDEGKPIKESDLDEQILSTDKIKELNKEHKQLYADRDEINQQHAEAHEELKKLNQEIHDLNKKLADQKLSPQEKEQLQHKIHLSIEKLKDHKPIVEMLNELKVKNDKIIEQKEEKLKIRKNTIDAFGKKITADDNKKYLDNPLHLKQKHSLLENQHKAIVSDGIVNDNDLRNKTLNKIADDKKVKKQANQIRDKMQNSSSSNSIPPKHRNTKGRER